MARTWKPREFDSLYEHFICREEYQFGGRAYYLRYRSRYKECIRRFAVVAPPTPIDVLDVGGGQLALMCMKLWGDRGVVADLPGPHLTYMAGLGVETIHWNLCKADPPFAEKFDLVFFSEVIEHLPIPGYIGTGTSPKGTAAGRYPDLHHTQPLPPPKPSLYGAGAAHL